MLEDLASCISQLNECVTFVCSPKSPPRQLPAGADVGEAADADDMINSVVGVRCVTSTELEVQMELEPSSYALLRAPSESTAMRWEKTGFLSHLYIKVIILPRQARDNHRENSKKARFVEGVATTPKLTARMRRRAWL